MLRNKKDPEQKTIEQELAELQRKFRVLEHDKRSYSEDSQAQIRKQRASVEKLSRENHKMKAELNETRAAGGPKIDTKMNTQKIATLGDAKDGLQVKFEQQVDNARMLQEHIESTKAEIERTRSALEAHGGKNAALDNSRATSKQIRMLENRLDQALQKFNAAIVSNRGLRQEIDTLRGERVIFDEIYTKLEKELQLKKREMASIIEQSNAAYEARDSAQAQMSTLKQQADREHTEFEREWRELGRLIDNDKKMKDFMRQKVSKSDDAVKSRSLPSNPASPTGASTAAMSMQAKSTGNQEKIKDCEEAFKKIQKATGICDIDELVSHFLSAEDQNFTLVQYNQELCADVEKLESQITTFKDECIILSGQSTRREDVEGIKLLETLDERLQDSHRKASEYDSRHLECLQTLTGIRQNVQLIFQRTGCQADDLPPGVSTDAKAGNGPSESTIMTYLGVVEHRITELLKLHHQWSLEDEEEEVVPNVKTRSTGPQIRLPSTVEEYSEDEDDELDDDRPFTKDELKTKTMQILNKKQNKKKHKGHHSQ